MTAGGTTEVPTESTTALPAPAVGRWAAACYAAALTFYLFSWNLRLSVLMSWVPGPPVWWGAAAVALCLVHRLTLRPRHVPPAVAGPAVLVVAALLLGVFPVLAGLGGPYSDAKVSALFLTTVPVFLAALLLLDTARARRAWVWSLAALGLATATAALFFHDTDGLAQSGRFSLATVDTITMGRLAGVAVLVLAYVAIVSRWLRWPALAVVGAGTAIMLEVGTRAPLLAVAVVLTVVIVISPWLRGRRFVPLVSLAGVVALATLYAVRTDSLAAARVLASPWGDEGREQLWSDALVAAVAHPMGIGWGSFPQVSELGAANANASGNAYAHNLLAEVLVEAGVVAAVVVLWVVVLAVVRVRRAAAAEPWEGLVLAALLYWLIVSMTSFDVVGNRVVWVALAGGLAAWAPRGARVAGRAMPADRHGESGARHAAPRV